MNSLRLLALSFLAFWLAASPAGACSLCASLMDQKTFREDAALSKIVLSGTITNSKPAAAGAPASSEFHIAATLKTDPALGDKKALALPRYLPVTDAKDPPRILLFCDVYKGELDFFRGTSVKSAEAVDYVKGAIALDPKDRPKLLRYYFDFLENADKEI